MLFVSNSLFFKPPELEFGQVRGVLRVILTAEQLYYLAIQGQLQIESTNLHEYEYIDTF